MQPIIFLTCKFESFVNGVLFNIQQTIQIDICTFSNGRGILLVEQMADETEEFSSGDRQGELSTWIRLWASAGCEQRIIERCGDC